ncbi:succinate dehydrogenase assembly factor 2 [Orbaceae bacterium ac157xtp]
MANTFVQIEWQCRRGMKELDLYFLPFYEYVFKSLNEEQKKQFEQLLKLDDLTLFECFFENRVLADPLLQSMIDLIKSSRQSYVE